MNKLFLLFSLTLVLLGLQTSEGTSIKIVDFGQILMSDELEVQSGSFKKLAEKYYKTKGLVYDSDHLVLQQKGLNNRDSSAYKTYVRVIFDIKRAKSDILTKPSEKPLFNQKDLDEFGEQINEETTKEAKVLERSKTVITTLNKMYCIKTSLKRQLKTQPIVIIDRYIIMNVNKMLMISLSCREEEKEKWQPIFNKMLTTFKIK